VGQQLSWLFRDAVRPHVCVDLSNVEFLTAATLGKVVTLHRELRELDGGLTIRNVRPQVYEIFEVVRLTALLDIEAVATMSAKNFVHAT
jgi:anti-anti-sigma factor